METMIDFDFKMSCILRKIFLVNFEIFHFDCHDKNIVHTFFKM